MGLNGDEWGNVELKQLTWALFGKQAGPQNSNYGHIDPVMWSKIMMNSNRYDDDDDDDNDDG